MTAPADRPATGNMTDAERRRAEEEQRRTDTANRDRAAGDAAARDRDRAAGDAARRGAAPGTGPVQRANDERGRTTEDRRPEETDAQRRERDRRANADLRTGDRTMRRIGDVDIREAGGRPSGQWPHVQARADQSSGADVTADVAGNMGSTTMGPGVQQDTTGGGAGGTAGGTAGTTGTAPAGGTGGGATGGATGARTA